MIDKILEAISLGEEGAQDSIGLFENISIANTNLAQTLSKGITSVVGSLTKLVNFIGKIVAKVQA